LNLKLGLGVAELGRSPEMNSENDCAAFFEGRRSSECPLVAGDCVTIVSGKRRGFCGVAVSLESSVPVRSYLVEFGDGSTETISQPDLTLDVDEQRKCLFAKQITKAGEDFFLAIYAVNSGFELVTSERHGADTRVPLSREDLDQIAQALQERNR
jgi:hypothetical protein